MKILNKLIKNDLQKNKQRTIVSIIGVVLSCALITALLGLFVSFQTTFKENALKSYGNRVVTFEDVKLEDINNIKNHKEVESYYLTHLETGVINKDFVGINYLDKFAKDELKNFIVEGRVPSKENEIVLDYTLFDNLNLKLNDEITITEGNRIRDGYELNDHNPKDEDFTETFEETKTTTYKVVGTAKYHIYLASEYGYNAYIYSTDTNTEKDIHLMYKNPKKYDEITAQINGTKLDTEQGKYNFNYNKEYLRWGFYSTSDKTKELLIGVVSIVAFIIMVTSIFCIRNSFAISVTDKTRLFGMLSSVGATPKQIKKCVLKEGFYLGIIGIPLGIASGIFASFILINLVEFVMSSNDFLSSDSFNFIYRISFISIVIATILSSITIFASAIGSAKRASKITEIEAIKNSKDIKIKNKKLKAPILIKKLFKMGGVFAYKNMQRNKSKYRTTVIAISVSITSFIALSYFMKIGFLTSSELLKSSTYNVGVQVNEKEGNDVDKIYDDLSKLDYVDDFNVHKTKSLIIDDSSLSVDAKESMEKYFYSLQIISISDDEYKEYLKENKYKDDFNKGILFTNEFMVYNEEENKTLRKKIINEELSKIITTNNQTKEKYEIEFTVSDKKFIGYENYIAQNMATLLLSEEEFNKIDTNMYYDQMNLVSNNARELENLVKEYESDNNLSFYITNIDEFVKAQKNMTTLIAVFLYGFIAVITFIGLTNIFNTITTNMMLRSREFAILKSIGMTKKEFNNMILLESIAYGFKSLFFGLLFGNLLAFLLYKVVSSAEAMQSGILLSYEPPVTAIIISIVFVFLVINLIMKYSLIKINKQNIIDTIKSENI